jgi:NAD(P)-dependent dehydrogenase (short-subunit alcohol dehydrogenase family)
MEKPDNSDHCTRPVFVILGAYGAVGSELAKQLHLRGAELMLVGRDKEKLSELAKGLHASFRTADATNFSEVQDCLEETKQTFGRISGLANCVGSRILKPAHLLGEREWLGIISTNLTSAFVCIKYASASMLEQGGSIVLVSSAAAHLGLANHEAIAAAKAGIEGLARSAAATYARHKIRINCVAPGLLDTPMSAAITASPMQLQASVSLHPLGRIGTAVEVAQAIAWLLGPEASWVTGQVLTIDGGLSSIKSLPQVKQTPR